MARGAALHLGATPLESLVVGQVAAYGAPCWLKDRELAEEITQRNGRNPHPRSVARARRNAAKMGLMLCERRFPGQRVPGKRTAVSYGTTLKVVRFDRFGQRDPLSRGQKRRIRMRQMAVEADYPPPVSREVTQPKDRPTHSYPPAPVDLERIDPELAALIRTTGDALERRETAQHAADDRRMMDSVRAARGRGPPE
jgi:hypothetical protein